MKPFPHLDKAAIIVLISRCVERARGFEERSETVTVGVLAAELLTERAASSSATGRLASSNERHGGYTEDVGGE